MRLRIVTPLAIIVDREDVVSIRAEDASGSFGILTGHADFLTALTISVLSYKAADDAWHYCAVRGGVMAVNSGRDVLVTSRDVVEGDDLDTLDETVLARFRADIETERSEHAESTRLHLAAIRQIMQHLRTHGTTGLGANS